MNIEDRLSKRGINLIFSKLEEGDNIVFSSVLLQKTIHFKRKIYIITLNYL